MPLGEIETALTDLPHVTDAVASTYVDDAGELRLRAFVAVDTVNLNVNAGEFLTLLAGAIHAEIAGLL